MKVLKPFMRGNRTYGVGEDFSDELSGPELAHYQRYGLLGETKPAKAEPAETKPAKPSEKK